MKALSNSGTSRITPAGGMLTGTTVTLNALGESVILMYSGSSSKWVVIGGNGYAIA